MISIEIGTKTIHIFIAVLKNIKPADYRLIKLEEELNVTKFEAQIVELNSTKGEKVDVDEILYRTLKT